jgi:drug/metabolite transporter (DMT)-like permease
LSDRTRAIFFLSMGTVMWGSTFLVIKPLLAAMSPAMVLLFRFGMATLVLLPFAFSAARRRSPGLPSLKSLIPGGILLGLALFCGYGLQTAGLQYTGPGKSAFITSLYVAFTPFAAWPINGRKPALRHFLSVAIALGGVYLLSDPTGPLNKGDALTAMGAVFWAVEIALIDRFWKSGRELETVTLMLGVVAVASTALLPVLGSRLSRMDIPVMGALLYLAIPATSMLMYWQIRWQPSLGGGLSSLIYIGEAAVAAAGGALFFGEKISLAGWIGCVLIVASILVAFRTEKATSNS